MSYINSTVAAISTPFGRGGIAVIRVTGQDAIAITDSVFRLRSKRTLAETPSNTAVYGAFYDKNGEFDDGLVTVFRAPRSFTGEDTTELACHGGILVASRLLSAVFSAGASPAGAGEFTKRAFINGKMSLSRAEAIGDIIDAKSDKHLEIGLSHSRGTLSKHIGNLISELTNIIASVYVDIDYPEETLSNITEPELKQRIEKALAEVKKLNESYRYGKAISEGIKTVIAGRPNTGKSSLLNMLSGYDRAIVTDIPGTTRDVITEQIKLGDIVLNLCDTAGIRESGDVAEKLGIEKTHEYIEDAEIIFLVVDASEGLTEEDKKIIESVYALGKEESTVLVFNKTDINGTVSEEELKALPHSVLISAKNNEGISKLEEKVSEICGKVETGSEIVTNARQNAALTKAYDALCNAQLRLRSCYTPDIVCIDLEDALSALGEIDGRSVSEEIVNEIFSHFCVGK